MIEKQIKDKNGIADLPTPDYEVLGLTTLSHLRPGDQLQLEDHCTPLTVEFVGVRQVATLDGETQQYALTASHDRADAQQYKLYEQINSIDGTVVQIVDGDGRPMRVYEVAQ